MLIWAHTASPPQTIGDTDGLTTVAELLQRARAARWPLRHAVRVVTGNAVAVRMFDTAERLDAFFIRNRDDCEIAERADLDVLTRQDCARIERDREAGRGHEPMPEGGLFDDVRRRTRDLF